MVAKDAPSEGGLGRLLARITRLANESTDTASTLRAAADDVAATMAWPTGRVVLLTEESGQESPDDTDDRTVGTSTAAEVLRRAVESRRAAWLSDDVAADAARGRIAFPVVTSGVPVAGFVFELPHGQTPSSELLEVMSAVGEQLGIVVDRNRVRADLEATKLELERSNRELEQFAYVASHDLREPLRKIVGFAGLLEKRYADRFEGEAREYLEYVTDGAARMSQLIEDLLRFSRVGRKRGPFEPVDLEAILDEVAELLSGPIEETGAVVTAPGRLPTVLGDDDQLFSLFSNLVGNAIKYRGDAPPTVTVTAEQLGSDGWRVTVEDNGIGIDPVHAERVFDVFQRLHTRTEYEGSGIGLAICRRIVENHGGEIWVESEPGAGARFHVTFPGQ